MSEPVERPFKRRCGWCARTLAWWQLNLCRTCRSRAHGSCGIYLSAGGPPCSMGARLRDPIDRWRKRDD